MRPLSHWFGKQKMKVRQQMRGGVENKQEENIAPTLDHMLAEFEGCADLIHRTFPQINTDVLFFAHLVGNDNFNRDVLTPLLNVNANDIDNLLQQSQFVEANDAKQCVKAILDGHAAIFYGQKTYTVDVYGPPSRSINQSETESVITGPHDAFIEDIATNLSLIRRRVKSSHLKSVKLSVGEITKSDIYVLYIKDLADQELVDELIRRIQDIEIDNVFEGNMLVQYIDENPNSVFPQFLTTERTDVVASKLVGGKIAVLVDSSPSAICAPTSFFEFFSSPDDHYQRWALGSALRLMRFVAFIITVAFTSFYVAVTTFHYEMIPQALLINLAESRSKVPFPPLIEALLMEIMIELLREAGARLPAKIGQTIGIVGGIVIGQAAVQAGLTSNVLIIAVASSAIASFVIPSYIMSASIRLLRFGLIILAGIWGNMGLLLGMGVIIIHLAGITNLGTSYLMPVAPMVFKDWKDTFIRGPLWAIKSRSSQSRTENEVKNKVRR